MSATAPSRTGAITLVVCWALLFLPGRMPATETQNNHYFGSLKKKLVEDGFHPENIETLYNRPQVYFEAGGATLLFTYSEAKLNYDQFTNDWSIRKAKAYMQTYQEDLAKAETSYGVDRCIITAILLVETALGSSVGKRSTLNSLSTLASLMDADVRELFWQMIPDDKRMSKSTFEKKAERRSQWAYKELKAFLRYADREGFDPVVIPGSFAGAMGLAQFMPSNILAYGRDGNGDGIIDLFEPADSMASIANFLKSHGWRPGISSKKAAEVIYHYNHSEYYVATILKIAQLLKSG
jgi:membrane-bound lytic murein transglycosylase B